MYTFTKYKTEFDRTEVTMSVDGDVATTWHDIMNDFVLFMLASGFYIDLKMLREWAEETSVVL